MKLSAFSRNWSRRLSLTLLILLSLAQVYSLSQVWLHPDSRFEIYRETGEWLRSNSPSDATVGTLEVGIIGYYAHRTMVDFAGLIEPDVSAQFNRKTTYEDAAFWAIARYHPVYLVLSDKVFPRLEQDYVSQNCTPVKRFPGPLYHYTSDLIVYTCS